MLKREVLKMDIQKCQDIKFKINSMLVEGVEKSGKTTFILTCPKPILMFDFERSSLSRYAGVKDVDVVKCYDDRGEAPGAGVRRFLKNYKELLMMKTISYKTIGIDPLSFGSDSIASELDRTNPGMKGGSNTFTFWGKLKTQQIEIVDNLLKLPCTVVFTSHVKLLEDETTGTKTFLPDINGSFRETIGSKVDAVFFTKVTPLGSKAKFELQLIPNSQKKCGMRVPFGQEHTIGATFPSDYAKIMEIITKPEEVKK